MAMSVEDWARLEKKFDRIDDHMIGFREDFSKHLIDDNSTALALKTHMDECAKEKKKKRYNWLFLTGLITVVLGALATAAFEHWFHAK